MINTQFRNSVKQTKTYPGAFIGSDHIPVVATVKMTRKRIKKKENMEQFNLDMLKEELMRQQYAVELNNIFACLKHDVSEQEYENDRVVILWTNIKEGIQKAAQYIANDGEEKQKALGQYRHTRHDRKTEKSEEHPKLR